MNAFGSMIRELRKGNGWTQEELGLRIGVEQCIISRWERGKHIPNARHMVYLAEELDIEAVELVELAEEDRSYGRWLT